MMLGPQSHRVTLCRCKQMFKNIAKTEISDNKKMKYPFYFMMLWYTLISNTRYGEGEKNRKALYYSKQEDKV